MTNLRFIAILFLFTIAACKHSKVLQNNTPAEKNMCGQTIRFYSDKITEMNGSQEFSANSEIVINPSIKIISVSTAYNGEKEEFEMEVESNECDLNNNLTAGKAIYNGNVKKDGTETKGAIKVEATDGAIVITGYDPERDGRGVIFQITKWEIE
jgi:hypothetical protein